MKCPYCGKEIFCVSHDVSDFYQEPKELTIEEQQAKRIKELDMLRAGVRVSLIACRAAVQKGGEVTEEILTELIDELKGGGA